MEEYSRLEGLARSLENKALATGFRQSLEVDRRSIELHASLSEIDSDTDLHVCDFCGYIAAGEPPANCPVCTARKERFKRIDFRS
jgi:rubrerythrin